MNNCTGIKFFANFGHLEAENKYQNYQNAAEQAIKQIMEEIERYGGKSFCEYFCDPSDLARGLHEAIIYSRMSQFLQAQLLGSIKFFLRDSQWIKFTFTHRWAFHFLELVTGSSAYDVAYPIVCDKLASEPCADEILASEIKARVWMEKL